MTDNVNVMISEEQVNQRIRELAEQISKDYEGKSVHLICILKGSIFFCCDLAKRLTIPVTLDFMSVSSYGSETVSSGRVRILKDLDESIQGKNVLIVEHIIDNGKHCILIGSTAQELRRVSLSVPYLINRTAELRILM